MYAGVVVVIVVVVFTVVVVVGMGVEPVQSGSSKAEKEDISNQIFVL